MEAEKAAKAQQQAQERGVPFCQLGCLRRLLLQRVRVAARPCSSYGGSSFQRFGPWMSVRPNMFSQSPVSKTSELRQDSPAHSAAISRQIFKERFGVVVEEFRRVLEQAYCI